MNFSDPQIAILAATMLCALAVFAAGCVAHTWRMKSSLSRHHAPPVPRGLVPVWFYRPMDLAGLAIILVLFSFFAFTTVTLAAKPEPPKLNTASLLANIAMQLLLAGAVTASLRRRVWPGQWLGLSWRGWPWVLLIGPTTVLAVILVFSSIAQLGYMEWVEAQGAETMQETVRILQDSTDRSLVAIMAITAVLVAPVCEEIVFRGYVYPVAKRFTGRWAALVFSALVFSVAHGSLVSLLPIFLLGLALAAVYEATGSIWAPIAVHCCFNSFTVLVQLAMRNQWIDLPNRL